MQARELLKASCGEIKKGQNELFMNDRGMNSRKPILTPPKQAKHSESELWGEYSALGFLRNAHPLVLWKDKVLAARRIKAAYIGDYTGRYVCLVGWSVTQKEVWTKDGLTMSFLTFEDETGLYETVIFPPVYDTYYPLLFDQRPLLVYGRVIKEWEAVSLEVTKVEGL
jgi:DNA polymerase-3 subunit alpha/error-prone DNA polymerase